MFIEVTTEGNKRLINVNHIERVTDNRIDFNNGFVVVDESYSVICDLIKEVK